MTSFDLIWRMRRRWSARIPMTKMAGLAVSIYKDFHTQNKAEINALLAQVRNNLKRLQLP